MSKYFNLIATTVSIDCFNRNVSHEVFHLQYSELFDLETYCESAKADIKLININSLEAVHDKVNSMGEGDVTWLALCGCNDVEPVMVIDGEKQTFGDTAPPVEIGGAEHAEIVEETPAISETPEIETASPTPDYLAKNPTL